MKKIISIGFCLFIFIGVKAQKNIPVLKNGTVISGTASMDNNDFDVTFTIVNLENPVSIGWSVNGYGDGTIEMTNKGVETANGLYLAQPAIGKTVLNDNQTFLIISKNSYKSIQENKTFSYNNIKFTVSASDAVIKINDTETDTIHLVMDGGKGEIWILNNPNFPLIMKSKGLPIDITIDSIK